MSKITPKAKARCERMTLQEQLEHYRLIHAVELAIAKKRETEPPKNTRGFDVRNSD